MHSQCAGDKQAAEDRATAVETPISQMPVRGKCNAAYEMSLWLFCSSTDQCASIYYVSVVNVLGCSACELSGKTDHIVLILTAEVECDVINEPAWIRGRYENVKT